MANKPDLYEVLEKCNNLNRKNRALEEEIQRLKEDKRLLFAGKRTFIMELEEYKKKLAELEEENRKLKFNICDEQDIAQVNLHRCRNEYEQKLVELQKKINGFACCDFVINRYGKKVVPWTPEGILIFDNFVKLIEKTFNIKVKLGKEKNEAKEEPSKEEIAELKRRKKELEDLPKIGIPLEDLKDKETEDGKD